MFLSLLDLLRQQSGRELLSNAEAAPAFELSDQGDVLLLRASLRGIDPKSVQVQVTESGIAIGGRRTVEERTEGPDQFRYLSAVSQFYRELRLPSRVNPHRATARWEEDSSLLLALPKE
ncbi:MAG TPA: Hsp20 family protein [Symbiobacteriaceae bacterium]|nr:Hsp20 family protein [Symbiobacteriaceae bacterium]